MGDRSARSTRSTRSAADRPALADLSNQVGKRKFVSVSNSSATGTENQNDAGNGIGKALFPGKDYVGVENLGKGKKIVFEFGGKGDGSVLKPKEVGGSWDLSSGVKPLQENSRFGNSQVKSSAVGISRIVGGTKLKGPAKTREDTGKKSVIEGGVGSISRGLMPKAPGNIDKEGKECEETGNTVINLCGNNDEGSDAGDLTSSKGVLGGSMPSVGSKESAKCAFLDGTSNTAAGMDILKSCSCSFCLKAAYIWSDLQYQDTKGRIAALKRSRKDVRSVIDRSCSYGGFGKSVLGSSNKPTKLEHDLMGQWRSLFLRTEDVLIQESSQLQSSLLSLKNLRTNCKNDLEKTGAASSKTID